MVGTVLYCRSLEPAHADPLQSLPAQAIVVLGGGQVSRRARIRRHDTVSELTLMRLRYAAYLHRRTGKPIWSAAAVPKVLLYPRQR